MERVWPDRLAALREAGWGNYSLFLTEDGMLAEYLETPDYQAALDRMAATEVNARWQRGNGALVTGSWRPARPGFQPVD